MWIENLKNKMQKKIEQKCWQKFAKICKNFQSFPSYNIVLEAIE